MLTESIRPSFNPYQPAHYLPAQIPTSALPENLQSAIFQLLGKALQTSPYFSGAAPKLDSKIYGFENLQYTSAPASSPQIMPAPADKPYIVGGIGTGPEAGQIKKFGLANVFTTEWRALVEDAAARNGGLGNADEGFLAWSDLGFVRLKNTNLSAEQNRKLAEISLLTGNSIDKLPSSVDESGEKITAWADKIIGRFDEAFTGFLANPADGFKVKDGHRRYEMKVDPQTKLVMSYSYKKHGGFAGFLENNMPSISKFLKGVSLVTRFIPGWGQIVSWGSTALNFLGSAFTPKPKLE